MTTTPAIVPLLAIESSCDETSAAVIGEGGAVLSNVVRSQVEEHRHYGGVVPELASRRHLEWIGPVVDEALARGGVTLDSVRAIAATRGPGLVGCLLVGTSYAEALAMSRRLPMLGVNHLEGHLFAPFVGREPPFPFLALTVSGGHTSLVLAEDVGRYDVLGETLDDAAGEAFDKSARLLDLPYPGGIAIDRLAEKGRADAVPFPRSLRGRQGYTFSFSGLKTAVRLHVERNGIPAGVELADFCASVQEAIVAHLLDRTRDAARDLRVRTVVVTGGVAANSRLRAAFAQAAEQEGWDLFRPEMRYCTDNAGMIGYAAWLRMRRGERGAGVVAASLPLGA
jgi:N6-L-threonylcarbamoyladenine synthase